jgi:hypothetical protein
VNFLFGIAIGFSLFALVTFISVVLSRRLSREQRDHNDRVDAFLAESNRHRNAFREALERISRASDYFVRRQELGLHDVFYAAALQGLLANPAFTKELGAHAVVSGKVDKVPSVIVVSAFNYASIALRHRREMAEAGLKAQEQKKTMEAAKS